jgi:CSLREA domain-containing protein
MNSKFSQIFTVTLLAFVLLTFTQPCVAEAKVPPVTTITVTTTADTKADGKSKTCLDEGPCTLRRAINQAYSLPIAERPVLIQFNIPVSDPGYIPGPGGGNGAWKIKIDGTSLDDLRYLNGQTTVDGSTQPDGRKKGPRIIIDGSLGSHNYGFNLYTGENVVRGVAMQNFKTHVIIGSDNNLVEKNWFGLSDDGQHLSAGDDFTYEGGSGVSVNSDNNIIRGNVFAGFWGTSFSISSSGDNNVFSGNKVGTRADGTVPVPAIFQMHPCTEGGWVGGSGISVAGENNRIGGPKKADRNIFAGIYLDISETSTQPPAIWVQSSKGHIVQNNWLGLDGKGKAVGVCGRGLDLGNGPEGLMVQDNVFAETGLSAIVMNSSSLNGNTLRGNIIKRSTPWPGPVGSSQSGEDAIAYGPFTPEALRNFTPAKVTKIAGKTVSGTSGDTSPCEDCTVELFLDDDDDITEALKSVAVTQADGNGDWTATLKAPLTPTSGLRTMSTVPDTFVISGLDTGTTSNLSELYPMAKPVISIVAKDKTALEPGTNTGTFKITRSRVNRAVTVLLKVGGTAKQGEDYTKLPEQVEIPADKDFVLVQVKPVNDQVKEKGETVIVFVRPSQDYDIKAPGKATVTIKDDDK